MCGISGFCDFSNNFTASEASANEHLHTLINMRKSIAYRGMDEHGEYLRKSVGLSHARLSIRDLPNGRQPMIRYQGSREYAIVFNGEIYNTDELISYLRKSGRVPDTTCDTEVILLMYMEYGIDFIGMLNGIFAFAIYDNIEDRLILARDHAGIKPLFYTIQNNLLVFGSEIKALFAHPQINPRINADSFREIFGIGPARTPGCGVFEGINEMKPGHYAIYNSSGLHTYKYWELTAKEHTDSYEKTVETVSFLVTDSIKRQMVSDVPVCSFLSGGIDSSIVTAVACNTFDNAGDFNTFSFDFTGNDKYFKSNKFQPERDNKYVDIMLSEFHTNHSYLQCNEEELISILKESTYAKDLPGMADVDASMLYFCSIVSKSNKVVLTGECADEIFGGYPWFYRPELTAGEGFPWSKTTDVRTSLLKDEFIDYLDLDNYVYDTYKTSVSQTPLLPGEDASKIKQRQISYLNIKWFMQTLLDRMDRTSMHYGLEARVPFADRRIMDYLYNVPWEMKYQNGVEKSLLREAFRGKLPDEVLFRKKSPYPKTYNPKYETMLGDKLRIILSDSNSPLRDICDAKKLNTLLQAPSEYGKPWFGQLMAFPQLLAYFIQLDYWFSMYKPEISL